MPTLRDIQSGIAHGILLGETANIDDHIVGDGIPAADRLGIYRNTARTVLTEALRLTFPVVDRLVGTDFFDMAAARFIRGYPPGSACLDDYGAKFADFLASLKEASKLRYLPDVARFEWALDVAAHAPDLPTLDLLSLAGLNTEQQASVRFKSHPSTTLLLLDFPADQIADAVLAGDESAMASVDLGSGPVALIVHRGSGGVTAERIELRFLGFLRRLFAGDELSALLAENVPDAADILAQQFAHGRITGFATHQPVPSGETIQ